MRQHNKSLFTVCCFLLLCVLLTGNVFVFAQQQQNQPQHSQTVQLPSDVNPYDPALPVWMRPATPTIPVTKGDREPWKMISQVHRVSLPVIVNDGRHLVMDLQPNNFTVYEKGEAQHILTCTRDDVPVSIGILVDNSGSMRDKRRKVSTAVLNLIKSSNHDDEVFVVNFNDQPYLDQEFTNNLDLMHEALDRLDSRGGTALYDAVIASADHLAKTAKREKKILLVITDGEDNQSRESLERAIRAVKDEKGPMIYTIGILGSEGKQHRAKRALEALSFQTGGIAFFPKSLDEVDAISQQVAHDIRNQYTIVHAPSDPPKPGDFRPVKVEAHASGYKNLTVRTKNGYFAGEQRAGANGK